MHCSVHCVQLVFPLLGENYLTEGYVVTPKTMDILKQHLKETGGMVCGSGLECGWVWVGVWVGVGGGVGVDGSVYGWVCL